MSESATTTMLAGPSVSALYGGRLSGFLAPAGGAGGPVNADFNTPRTRAAMTRGPPSGLKFARIFAGSGIARPSRGTSPESGLLVSNGVNSIVALGALARKPDDATVICVRSDVAGSAWLMPSRILNHAT